MTLADTSAWVEYLRGTGSSVNVRLRDIIARGEPLAVTEVVVMELLAGAADDVRRDTLRRLLYRFELLSTGGLATYEAAAELYRRCRSAGETPRRMTVCLIAAVAIRAGAEVLHRDVDFEVLARHSELTTVASSPDPP